MSAIWRPNCGYMQGLMLYILFAGISVLLAVALMSFLLEAHERSSHRVFWVVGILIGVLPPLYDIGFHPQFYTYNHVFGGVLGPIYDEQLAIRPGLFVFRLLTLLWVGFLLLLRRLLRDNRGTVLIGFVALLIGAAYAQPAELGFVTTRDKLRRALPGTRLTDHFEIRYDPRVISDTEISQIAGDHEFRYEQMSRRLQETVSGRIETYIYPDPEVKARLTGARYTNIAPIWLDEPQIHILYASYDDVFAHELAHVFSREFGLPWLRASIAVGLIEGLAVALEPPDGRPTPSEQMSADLLASSDERDALKQVRERASAVARRLDPVRFWTGRGAVSYTSMGSFVEYLLAAYGPERLKKAYACADFRGVYGKSAGELAQEWSQHVLSLPWVSASARDHVRRRFVIPSLFEKRCPHFVSAHERLYERAAIALLRRDSLAAETHAEEALHLRPDHVPSLELWTGLQLERGSAHEVLERIALADLDSISATLYLRLGDAYARLGDASRAQTNYRSALARLPSHAIESRSRILLRYLATDSVAGVYANQGLEALRAWRKERYEQAFALMRTIPPDAFEPETIAAHGFSGDSPAAIGAEISRRRWVWLARLAYYNGHYDDAAAFADSARAAYVQIGAFNEAAVQRDWRDRAQWSAVRGMGQLAAMGIMREDT